MKPSFRRSSNQCQTLPGVSEEDDVYSSQPHMTSVAPLPPKSLGFSNRNSRRISGRPRPIGLTGLEKHVGLEALLLATRSPTIPESTTTDSDSSNRPVTLNLDGISLDFPRPPLSSSPASSSKSLSPKDVHSPTLSIASTSNSSTGGLPLTPISSDDEFSLTPVAPLSISKRSKCGMVNVNDNQPGCRQVFTPLDKVGSEGLHLRLSGLIEEIKLSECEWKERSIVDSATPVASSSTQQVHAQEQVPDNGNDDYVVCADVDDEDDVDYYGSDIATHLRILSSFSTAPSQQTGNNAPRPLSQQTSRSSLRLPPARPDSLPPPPHFRRRSSASSLGSVKSNGSGRSTTKIRSSGLVRVLARKKSRGSKPLPPTPTSPFVPSRQLDPSFPRRTRRSYLLPSRPPPPPPQLPELPVVPSTDITAITNVQVAANAKDEVKVKVPVRPRPLPRSSLPLDVEFTDPFLDDIPPVPTVPSCGEVIVRVDENIAPLDPAPPRLARTPPPPIRTPSPAISATRPFQLGSRTVAPVDVPMSPDFSPLSPYDVHDSHLSVPFEHWHVPDTASSTLSNAEEPVDPRLRSRWSMSTLASVPDASPSRSIGSWISSKFARAEQIVKEKAEKAKAVRPASQATAEPLPFPFFPTPSAPPPKRKEYVPYKYPKAPMSASSTSSVSVRSSSPARNSTAATPSPGSASSPGPSPSPNASTTGGKGALQRAQIRAIQAQKAYRQHKQQRSSESLSSFYSASTSSQNRAINNNENISSFTFVPTSSRSSHARTDSNTSSSVHLAATSSMTSVSASVSGPATPLAPHLRGLAREEKRMSASSAHSTASASSSESSGRRRKPIPVEIFIR